MQLLLKLHLPPLPLLSLSSPSSLLSLFSPLLLSFSLSLSTLSPLSPLPPTLSPSLSPLSLISLSLLSLSPSLYPLSPLYLPSLFPFLPSSLPSLSLSLHSLSLSLPPSLSSLSSLSINVSLWYLYISLVTFPNFLLSFFNVICFCSSTLLTTMIRISSSRLEGCSTPVCRALDTLILQSPPSHSPWYVCIYVFYLAESM